MMPKARWTEMRWADVAAADTARWIAVLPVAAVEQHGPHLPLGTDSFIAEGYIANAQALLPATLPATFLPLQTIGMSDEHRAFVGTLTLDAPSAIDTWTAIGDSLARAGVRKLVLVTAHGGNVAAIDIVARDLRLRHGMLAVTASWHRLGYPPGLFTDDERRLGIHGGDIETSLMLALRPDLVDMTKVARFGSIAERMDTDNAHLRATSPIGFGWMAQDLNPRGVVGDATRATAAKGRAALEHGARAFVDLLADVDRFDLAQLANAPRL